MTGRPEKWVDARCACGRLTMSAPKIVKMTELRCPWCPPTKPPTALTLVTDPPDRFS